MVSLQFELKIATDPAWIRVVLSDFDAFLQDHAACERKAAAMGISFVVQYPDRHRIIEPMIQFAREELEHFQQVCRIMIERGVSGAPDERDPYVRGLLKHVRTTRDTRFLDRLIMASVIEARGCERLQLVTDALEDEHLIPLYQRLTRAERGHKNFFIQQAQHYFDNSTIQTRLDEFLVYERDVIQSLPIRAAVH